LAPTRPTSAYSMRSGSSARAAHDEEHSAVVPSWVRDRALTLVLVALFAVSLAGQFATGFHEYNSDRQLHGEAQVDAAGYFRTGHPWEALFENWESEFLQMAVFVLLTTVLVQRGSPESRRPGVTELVDVDPRDYADRLEVPWPVRRGGWVLRLYENSLGLAFVCLSWCRGAAMRGVASPTSSTTS
jgi:Domain of unknown function (DUF6766)